MPFTRLTLVAHDPARAGFVWNDEPAHNRRVVFIDPHIQLRLSIGAAVSEPMLDIERVILDRVGDADLFLDVLASLPSEFPGDVLRVTERGTGFLSATGRGGDRVLYALHPHDVDFYLATHGLVALLEQTA